jgi:choline dehydrogenase
VLQNGQVSFIEAAGEVILACGAIQTPKLLMHSGVGDRELLQNAEIECIAHLPGVGRNLQDHPLISLAWKSSSCKSVSASAQAVAFLNCGAASTAPDSYLLATEIPSSTPDGGVSWAIGAALLTPESRGSVTVLDADPTRKPQIRANYLSAGHDLDVLKKALEVATEIGNSSAMGHLASSILSAPEGGLAGFEQHIRSKTRSGWHLCGTCKMGNDDLSVVDGLLQVHGVAGLRICDTSVLPNVTRGNTMAPAVVIGERLAQIIS